ncbi:MAG: radical SAM protein [Candidatus Methanomethylicus sp.]|nr:radical SAM protein [Candidatus Methanomethylicus sp.]
MSRVIDPQGLEKKVIFYVPSPAVFPISITGKRCELGCPHCDGKFLESMNPATMPPDVIRAFDTAKAGGAKCVLISGGFSRKGKLPIEGMISAIREGKARTGLKVEVHSGVVEDSTIKALGQAGVDALLLDVIGDDITISEYLGGRWSVADYRKVLKSAKEVIPVIAAHVLIGIDRGKIRGEYNAIDIISEANVDSCALLVLIDEVVPDPMEVERLMTYAREKLTNLHLTLGCMRGKGSNRQLYEIMAIDIGLDGIANPSRETVEYALAKKRQIINENGCCFFCP